MTSLTITDSFNFTLPTESIDTEKYLSVKHQ